MNSPHIFISYSHQDSHFVHHLQQLLKGEFGFSTWLDTVSIKGGDNWRTSIHKGIDNSFAIVLVISPDSMSSEFVTYEWMYATGKSIPIIPIKFRYDDKMFIYDALKSIQMCDFTSPTYPEEDKLSNALKRELNRYEKSVESSKSLYNIEQVLNYLEHGDEVARLEAIEVAYKLGNASLFQPLTRLLEMNNAEITKQTLRAMTKIDEQNSIQYIFDGYFSVPDNRLRVVFERQIEVTDTDEMIKLFIEKATNTHRIVVDENGIPIERVWAITILGVLGKKVNLDNVLVKLMEEDNEHIVGHVIGAINTRHAESYLIKKMREFKEDKRKFILSGGVEITIKALVGLKMELLIEFHVGDDVWESGHIPTPRRKIVFE